MILISKWKLHMLKDSNKKWIKYLMIFLKNYLIMIKVYRYIQHLKKILANQKNH